MCENSKNITVNYQKNFARLPSICNELIIIVALKEFSERANRDTQLSVSQNELFAKISNNRHY